MGALQIVASRAMPAGAFSGGARPWEAVAISSRAATWLKSSALHSPHAVPAANSPRGLAIIKAANPSHSGRSAAQPNDWGGTSEAIAPGAVILNSSGFARCNQATKPPEMTTSAKPAIIRWPIIIAGIAIISG